MRKIANEDARNLFLTACGDGARFRPAAKWFTHRTSLAWFAGPTAERSWGRRAAMAGVNRGNTLPRVSAVAGSGLFAKRKTSSARVASVDADRFRGEIVVERE